MDYDSAAEVLFYLFWDLIWGGGWICKIRMSKQELHFLLKLFLTFKHTIMATIDFSIVAFP